MEGKKLRSKKPCYIRKIALIVVAITVLTISALFSTKMLSFFKNETTRIRRSTLSLSNNRTNIETIFLFFIFISTLASSAKFKRRYDKTKEKPKKKKIYHSRISPVSKALEEVVGLIPEARLLRVKITEREGTAFALHTPISSHGLDDHVQRWSPISSRRQKIVPSISMFIVLTYIATQIIKKYYLALNPFCSGIVSVFLKSAVLNKYQL